MSLISIVIPCFNEDENVVEITSKIKSIFKEELPEDKYEIIFIDNGSADKTQEKIKAICKSDKDVKLIINDYPCSYINIPDIGDINQDFFINISDIVLLIDIILLLT